MEKQISFTYAPSRGKGILFLFTVCSLLTAVEVFLWKKFNVNQIDTRFILMLIVLLIFAVPLAFLLYRLYSLIFSYYRLERDGLHIQWGLRAETIPLNAIEWVRSPRELTEDVPWSVLPMPGAYLGTVQVDEHLTYEFLASDTDKMLFLGTPRYIYVISPRDPAGFMTGFERILQMGALTNVHWVSSRPGNWLVEAWNNKTGRIFTLVSAGCLILLYILAGLRFQPIDVFSNMFTAGPEDLQIASAIRLQVLPLVGTAIWIMGTLLGLWIFQQKDSRRIAELVWGAVSAAVFQCLIAAVLIYAQMV